MFQFTRPQRARLSSIGTKFANNKFQFTRPQGARLGILSIPLFSACFNSRAHEGRDQTSLFASPRQLCFNSRAHEGRDLRYFLVVRNTHSFQFTRPQGARQTHTARGSPVLGVSIHAPARGATQCKKGKSNQRWEFQFTRPQGARLIPSSTHFVHSKFQFTRPQGARP